MEHNKPGKHITSSIKIDIDLHHQNLSDTPHAWLSDLILHISNKKVINSFQQASYMVNIEYLTN